MHDAIQIPKLQEVPLYRLTLHTPLTPTTTGMGNIEIRFRRAGVISPRIGIDLHPQLSDELNDLLVIAHGYCRLDVLGVTFNKNSF
ncbi:hypothetical protein D3C78_1482220 [compost metagenome]